MGRSSCGVLRVIGAACLFGSALLGGACGRIDFSTDPGRLDAQLGPHDAGVPDAPRIDAGGIDAGGIDAGNDAGHDAGARDAGPGEGILPPKLLWPLSTSVVHARNPVMRWQLAAGTDGAHVQLCADRACATVLAESDVSGALGVSLAPSGVTQETVYWRAFGMSGATRGPTASPVWQMARLARDTGMSTTVGLVTDFNGDGLADVAIGAELVASDTGAVYVYQGRSGSLPTTPAATLPGLDAAAHFGVSAARAGDVNGDGFGDLLVGAPAYLSDAGRVYVYHGSATGLRATPDTTLDVPAPDGAGSAFGLSLSAAGDVNGDGYGDVVIGARGAGASGTAGRAFVFLGGAPGLATTPAVTLNAPDGAGSRFGSSVSGGSDFNGDGFADVVVGAPSYNASAGALYVFNGSASGVSATHAFRDTSPFAGMRWGAAVANVGDRNGDGIAGFAVGRPGPLPPMVDMTYAGSAYWYDGHATGFMFSSTNITTGLGGSLLGDTLVGGGDVTGDGLSDTVVGAWNSNGGEGFAVVCHGDVSDTGGFCPRLTAVDGAGGNFGFAVAMPGDMDGDGAWEVVVGAPGASSTTGRVYVYRGQIGGPFSTTSATSWTGPAGAGGGFGTSTT